MFCIRVRIIYLCINALSPIHRAYIPFKCMCTHAHIHMQHALITCSYECTHACTHTKTHTHIQYSLITYNNKYQQNVCMLSNFHVSIHESSYKCVDEVQVSHTIRTSSCLTQRLLATENALARHSISTHGHTRAHTHTQTHTHKLMHARTHEYCHAKISPGKNWSGRTTFRCQNWSDPGLLLVAKSGPGCQKSSG